MTVPPITAVEIEYGRLVAEMALGIENFERTGDSAYAFQAYAAWRRSRRLFPDFRSALLQRTGGTQLDDDTGQSWTEKVLGMIDQLAEAAEPSPAAAIEIKHRGVIETLERNLSIARSIRDRCKDDQTLYSKKSAFTKAHIVAMTAKAHGLGEAMVRKIWDQHLADNGMTLAFDKEMEALKVAKPKAQSLRAAATPKPSLQMKGGKASAAHPWRKGWQK